MRSRNMAVPVMTPLPLAPPLLSAGPLAQPASMAVARPSALNARIDLKLMRLPSLWSKWGIQLSAMLNLRR